MSHDRALPLRNACGVNFPIMRTGLSGKADWKLPRKLLVAFATAAAFQISLCSYSGTAATAEEAEKPAHPQQEPPHAGEEEPSAGAHEGETTLMTARAAGKAAAGVVIGLQDLLEIKVFQLDQLNQTLRVADDGSITLSLLGRIMVAGLTCEQAERRIAGLLEARYINDPQVSVFVREYESRKVAVTGAVQRPGAYEMLGEKTVLEMIALAGGVTRDAAKQVFVIRRQPGDAPRSIALKLDELIYTGDPAVNIPLQPGDIVYLPAEALFKVYVNGAVGKPGALEVKESEQITVLQAVTAAAGTTERAAERRVQVIRRGKDGKKQIIPVDLKRVKQGSAEDILLVKDDVVFVPEAFF